MDTFRFDYFERLKLLKAMEYVCRHINSEEVIDVWFALGIEDGLVPYGDLTEDGAHGELDYYIEHAEFSYLMRLFMRVMKMASDDGGLYCNGVSSKEQ